MEITNEFTENQTKWLEALESGDFKQVTGVLRGRKKEGDPIGYCCLGVACKLITPHSSAIVIKSGDLSAQGWNVSTILSGGNQTVTPKVQKEMNFRLNEGGKNEFGDTLANMNDNGVSFNAIAKEVRDNPGRYFANFTPPTEGEYVV